MSDSLKVLSRPKQQLGRDWRAMAGLVVRSQKSKIRLRMVTEEVDASTVMKKLMKNLMITLVILSICGIYSISTTYY